MSFMPMGGLFSNGTNSPTGLSRALRENERYMRGFDMVRQGQDTRDVKHWTQGLAKLLQTGVGTWEMNKGREEESTRKAERSKKLADALRMAEGDPMGAMRAIAELDEDGSTAAQSIMHGIQRRDRQADRAEERQWRVEDRQDAQAFQREMAAAARANRQGQAPIQVDAGDRILLMDPTTRQVIQEIPKGAKPGGGGGPFSGTSMDAQTMNMLLQGDPASPEYAAAYAHLATPRAQMDPQTGQTVLIAPDMSPYRRPIGANPMSQASPNGGVPLPSDGSAPVAPTVPTGQTGQAGSGSPGAPTVSRIGDPRLPTAEAGKLRTAQIEAEALFKALDDFTASVNNAGTMDRAAAVVGYNTPDAAAMNTKWANAALLAKGESLYNLGVLNGADLEVIRRALTDPSTVRGGFTGPEAYKAQADAIKKLITDRVNAFENKANLPPSQFGASPAPAPQPLPAGAPPAPAQPAIPQQPQAPANPGAPPPPQPGAVVDGYRFKGGDPADPNSWEAVQ